MSGDLTGPRSDKTFEDLRHVNEHGAEYWNARELQPLLGYEQWRRFENAIKKAITSCQQSGNDPDHHFAGARKMVELGSGSLRQVTEYHLSRFACYLIAQNGDPRKPEIANAQKYFAIQTRRQELSDAQAADLERLEQIARRHTKLADVSSSLGAAELDLPAPPHRQSAFTIQPSGSLLESEFST